MLEPALQERRRAEWLQRWSPHAGARIAGTPQRRMAAALEPAVQKRRWAEGAAALKSAVPKSAAC
jgi:hypothetical protein